MFRSLSDVSYSDECRTKKSFSVWLKHGTAFSCCSEDLYIYYIYTHLYHSFRYLVMFILSFSMYQYNPTSSAKSPRDGTKAQGEDVAFFSHFLKTVLLPYGKTRQHQLGIPCLNELTVAIVSCYAGHLLQSQNMQTAAMPISTQCSS